MERGRSRAQRRLVDRLITPKANSPGSFLRRFRRRKLGFAADLLSLSRAGLGLRVFLFAIPPTAVPLGRPGRDESGASFSPTFCNWRVFNPSCCKRQRPMPLPLFVSTSIPQTGKASSMRIRFSKHALQRIRERFPGMLDALTRIIERALCDQHATGRYVGAVVQGVIDGRRSLRGAGRQADIHPHGHHRDVVLIHNQSPTEPDRRTENDQALPKRQPAVVLLPCAAIVGP